MKLDRFAYDLPEDLIAQEPLTRRDQARLMVIDRGKGSITHDVFSNISAHLPDRASLVINDSKVVPARLLGKRASGGEVEIFLLNRLKDGYSYETLMRPLRRLKMDEKICFNGGELVAQIKDKENRIVRFNRKNISPYLDRLGHIPLPPYIKRSDKASDRKYYQTVYAQKEGSVASPTAGLHFTNRLIRRMEKSGHRFHRVTLHINYATFKPVEAQDITRHQMHVEQYSMTRTAFDRIMAARRQKRKTVAVGTTSCRVLETVGQTGKLKGRTDIFMYPGYRFQMTDILLTNFHLPYSTLLMLVYAFGGEELIKKAYEEAIEKKYRFYSYGDAMLII